ncbi:MAG: LarC family nickel insertion protein, partial [Planctomycetes bacterium]|nr:LarC family nickel insertion protein [Planctomycetota bacterium]
MKIAYFDCFAGCGGDMIVAAMIDAGFDADFLQSRLDSLGIADLKIKVEKVMRCGISALHFTPAAPGEHHHRKLSDIIEIIQQSNIGEFAKGHAVEIFRKLAEVEGRIHAKDVEAIHFHEVGAVDSIADIVSACVGFEALGLEEVCCSALSVGGGTIQSAHGLLPVPAPATVELLKQAGAPLVGGPVDSELLTPTAAVILT